MNIPQDQYPAADPNARKPVIVLFSDDSTLIFAQRMRAALLAADPDCPVQMTWFADESVLSYRQISQLLPEGPSRIVTRQDLIALMQDPDVSAILTSRIYRAMLARLKNPVARWSGNRPCVVSFLGGLDFFPEQGFMRRLHCDGVYLFPRGAIKDYNALAADLDAGWQDVGFGHPSALLPQGAPADLDQRRDIFFFTQALSPSTKRGRIHMLRMMAAIARANPDRKVFIKLRHLPNENRKHLHLERYDYPSLMKALGTVPENLHLTDITMEKALETAALGITCTSTAAIDLLRAGLPSMVHLDYVDAYRDPLVEPMRRLFANSNLITPTERVLTLDPPSPDPRWMEDMFCPRDLGTRVLDTVARFHDREFQIRQTL
ncbi:hypothetical protein EOK75_20610 (plasmid) [Pseudorhodobacter turbinis]|uniref:UDP-N-acetylglucosamine 2-epimerase domain-containing protein n=1 Tax=Pseudorhodobacter turbinis TaxID=2500533 RepID=A0A4P8ELJ2_9RHOB|nr:DUF6716 putative glycosyltransferase [Pseudorhodobacter turbinis]QCO58161.1 hypothetical protein EOK75_20610 [Pseudorhodobacter turbinis]